MITKNAWNNYMHVVCGSDCIKNEDKSRTIGSLNLGIRIAAYTSLATIAVPIIFGLCFLFEKGYENLKGRFTKNPITEESSTTKKTKGQNPIQLNREEITHKNAKKELSKLIELKKATLTEQKNEEFSEEIKNIYGYESLKYCEYGSRGVIAIELTFYCQNQGGLVWIQYYFPSKRFIQVTRKDTINNNETSIRHLQSIDSQSDHCHPEDLARIRLAIDAIRKHNEI